MLNKVLRGGLNASSFILLTIAELGGITVEAFHPKKYAFTQLGRSVLGLDSEDIKWRDRTLKDKMRQLIQNGLVVKDKKCKNYCLSPSGRKISDEINDYFSSINQKWDRIFRIIIFDIPKKKNKYRDWLRNNLYSLNFKQLQKSVFIGKNPLPESFVKEIGYFKLDDFVHIFSVKEIDTRREIIKNWKND